MNKQSFRECDKFQNINKDLLYKELFSSYPEPLYLLDCRGHFQEINEGLVNLSGFSEEELLYSHFSNYIYKMDLQQISNSFNTAALGSYIEDECRIVHKNGSIKFLSVNLVPAKIGEEIIGVYGVAKDITDKKMLEVKVKESEVRLETLLQHSSDAIAVLTEEGIIKYASPTVKQLLGYTPEMIVGTSCFNWIERTDIERVQNLFESILENPTSITKKAEISLKRINGNMVYCEAIITNLLEYENIKGIVVNYRDITSRKNNEEEIKQLAYYDYLTGLPNRYLFEKSLSKELTKNNQLAILFIDLDRFKVINDSMGHLIGDQLLIEVANRLKYILAENDLLFRQGGDEFVIVLTNVDREAAATVSKKIVQLLDSPFSISNYDVFTTPSIGISMFPEDGTSVEQLTKNADFAMYQAKKNGKNTFHFYSPPEVSDEISPLDIELGLHSVIERNQLVLYYQPKVNLVTNEIIGVEALIRWIHPVWGIVSPGMFIPIAEESGQIIPIGEWALREACIQNKLWQEQGFEGVMSVNLSPRQFTKVELVQTVKNVLEETGLEPHLLELEITETMTANTEQTIATLHDLKRLGIKISIDDFGTGFSSLNYLKQFPVDTLKIDQSFVRELSNGTSDATIVKTIIAMAHNLNLNVVAEGIETKEQLVFLQEHNCNEGQGYFFSKPVPVIELETKIQEIKKVIEEHGMNLVEKRKEEILLKSE
ncbi:sensor domain-containing protein [Bacillus sp. FJAT-45350]|uniref:sensor domain-containing protein n=1 Tax=Bacillus sp. FJAT-45350 TaxID=2011014 RepID=UPI000BB85F0D|nr:bifunctional diguanylate cyclase/phosphodiesterase [Bacillus sp. FJAT-45350]